MARSTFTHNIVNILPKYSIISKAKVKPLYNINLEEENRSPKNEMKSATVIINQIKLISGRNSKKKSASFSYHALKGQTDLRKDNRKRNSKEETVVRALIFNLIASEKKQKNQKWHPQQRKNTQSAETKNTASKAETILKRTSSINQRCKLNLFFHTELFNFHRHAPRLPLPVAFLFSLLKKNEKVDVEVEGFFLHDWEKEKMGWL